MLFISLIPIFPIVIYSLPSNKVNCLLKDEFVSLNNINKDDFMFYLFFSNNDSNIHKKYCAFDNSKLSEFRIINNTGNLHKKTL